MPVPSVSTDPVPEPVPEAGPSVSSGSSEDKSENSDENLAPKVATQYLISYGGSAFDARRQNEMFPTCIIFKSSLLF